MTVRIWQWPTRVVLLLAMGLAVLTLQATNARADYALLEGDGSTWSQGIVNQWIADAKPMGMQVVYSGIGSSGGRKSFANFQDDFAISEIPYQGVDPITKEEDASNIRQYAYLPIVAGGTSFTYHVTQAGALMRDVRLSGETIAKIFTGQITNWNDPAIAADNNGRTFPDLTIRPVYRSDGSGTTAQFTTWLDKQYPAIWRTLWSQGGLTSNYPSFGKAIGANGSDQVMNTIAADSGNGTIGYVEYSYALNKGYPVVKVLNAAGYYVEPTAYNVAVALTKARIDMQDPSSLSYLTQILDDVYTNPDPRTYPLSSYSYMILPVGSVDRRMTTAKRQTLVDFMTYGLCTGQGQAGPYGYSPLPLNLVQAGMTQLAKIKAADPAVSIDNVDPTKCGNPTFVAGDLTRNHLAEIAPQPADCDKQGAGPCLGGATVVVGADGKPTTSGAPGQQAGASKPGASAGASAAAAAAGGGQIDPETGQVLGSGSADGSTTASGPVATTIAARPAVGTTLFAGLTALELVGLMVVPGVLYARTRRPEEDVQ
ncbi:phosphate ABC transporter substrate-binding protein PstS [Cellulomonas citrea]|uniref:phosphate ABC transporter substrate-binding protein PstS n=1 Tax=Cellulomonas citrea TaxID=1909423 RepID=UPI0019166449|nr:phosphate ABC transporter substrate-binding protein PstS [Cellulomonas citrea]